MKGIYPRYLKAFQTFKICLTVNIFVPHVSGEVEAESEDEDDDDDDCKKGSMDEVCKYSAFYSKACNNNDLQLRVLFACHVMTLPSAVHI